MESLITSIEYRENAGNTETAFLLSTTPTEYLKLPYLYMDDTKFYKAGQTFTPSAPIDNKNLFSLKLSCTFEQLKMKAKVNAVAGNSAVAL